MLAPRPPNPPAPTPALLLQFFERMLAVDGAPNTPARVFPSIDSHDPFVQHVATSPTLQWCAVSVSADVKDLAKQFLSDFFRPEHRDPAVDKLRSALRNLFGMNSSAPPSFYGTTLNKSLFQANRSAVVRPAHPVSPSDATRSQAVRAHLASH